MPSRLPRDLLPPIRFAELYFAALAYQLVQIYIIMTLYIHLMDINSITTLCVSIQTVINIFLFTLSTLPRLAANLGTRFRVLIIVDRGCWMDTWLLV